jgi:hypothetical protein
VVARARAQAVHADGDGGAKHGPQAEHEERIGHSMTVEVDDITHGAGRCAGGKELAEVAPEAGSSSGAELPPDAGLPMTRNMTAPIATAPAPTSTWKGGDGHAERKIEQRRHAPYREEVAWERADHDVCDEGGYQSDGDRQGNHSREALGQIGGDRANR